jgi:hypothetical protein
MPLSKEEFEEFLNRVEKVLVEELKIIAKMESIHVAYPERLNKMII